MFAYYAEPANFMRSNVSALCTLHAEIMKRLRFTLIKVRVLCECAMDLCVRVPCNLTEVAVRNRD